MPPVNTNYFFKTFLNVKDSKASPPVVVNHEVLEKISLEGNHPKSEPQLQ